MSHLKTIPLGSFNPSLNNSANNGLASIDLASGIILQALILDLRATVTVAVAGPAAISEAGLGGAISEVFLQDGRKTIIPAGVTGWIFDNLCRAEHGKPARSDMAPVAAVAANLRWYAFLPFADKRQLDDMKLSTCLPTLKGAKMRVNFGPWDGVYLAGSPPTTYAVTNAVLNVWGVEVNEPIYIQQNRIERFVPPSYYIDGPAAFAAAQTFPHRLPIQPSQWLEKAILMHAPDTAAARFLEYGNVKLESGTTPIDDVPLDVIQEDFRLDKDIAVADVHRGITVLNKSDQGRGTGLIELGNKDVNIRIAQTAATTRTRLCAFKFLDDISVGAMGQAREGGRL